MQKSPSSETAADWCVYLLLCENGALYCGIAKDAAKRFAAHKAGKGAKYTRMHKPQQMRVVADKLDKSNASAWEAQIKKMSRAEKEKWWAEGLVVETV
ncbi:MAG: GIY-YIG nuclease family protein [Neisseria sp.]|nr:GIY-YIG nuclease family protein [Neisseria sp.]